MPDFGIYAGDTDKTIYVRLRDSSTGLAKTGLLYNSTGAVCSYTLPGAARAAISLATLASASADHSDGGFILVDDTNCKGLYRLDLPDAAIASGAFTVISIEFDGIIEESIEIPLHTPNVNVTEVAGETASATAGVDFDDLATILARLVGTIAAGTHTAQTGDSFARIGATGSGLTSLAQAALVTAARMGALDDWINNGRLDLILDAVLADVTGLNGDVMRGTDGANTTVPDAAGTLATYDPPTKAEMDTAFTEIKGATWASGTDTLEAIRNRGDAAWITATSVTVSDKTGFSLANGSIAAATFAANAIDAAALAADAVAEIQSGLATAVALADVPTTAEFEARTILAAAYFDPAADTVAQVTLVDTTTDVTNEVTADATKISGSADAADKLEASARTIFLGAATSDGAADGTTIIDTTLGARNDTWIGRVVIIRSGTTINEATPITDYVAATFTLTVDALTGKVSSGDTYEII